MSAYATQSQLQALIPGPHLVDALDDDGDQLADPGLLDTIIAQASLAVDALLAGLYTTPFTNPPVAVQRAALIFAAELIYARRERETNPFTKEANIWRERLERIGHGKEALDATAASAFTPGAVVTEAEDSLVNASMR